MTFSPVAIPIDPTRDLTLERTVDVSPELVWKAWTTPKHLMRWYTPAPWQTIACEIDLRPGGLFKTIMRSPEGEEFPNLGTYLEIIPNRRLVWTDALEVGFRPAKKSGTCLPFFLTAVITIEANGTGTKYTATALHSDADGQRQHAEMGFKDGWSQTFEQLVAMCKLGLD